MADDKNLFNFGTGNIKKDQWLRDIDSEQDAFISRYTNATNKRKGLLLRLAFAELRKRIGSGDMLGRDDAGSFQFASSLNNEDKDVLEAQLRALGFMAALGRRLIQTPAAEPEKKTIGSLEERYIKSLNPSGKFNTEAYWKNLTDEERRAALKIFLNKELKDAESYQDFGAFGDKDTYTQRLQAVMNLLESGKANDWSLQQLGFTKNWLAQPTDLQETETPKSELEQANERLQAATEAQQIQQINQLVAALTAPSPTYQALLTFNPSDYWNYDSFTKDRNKRIEALKYIDANGNEFLKANSILRRTPTGNGYFTNQVTTKNTAWNGQAAKDARTYALSQYAQEVSSRLNNYFKNLGVNYQSILNNDKRGLMTNLAQLFTQGPDNNYVMSDVLNDLFVRLLDGKFGLRGSTLSYDPSTHTLYNGSNIDAYKEGGILKGLNGLIVDDSYYVKPTNNTKKDEEIPKLENSEEMDAGDWVTILGTTAADIGSMLSANAVGAGTAVSAGLGVASTLGNSVNDFRHGNVGSGLANLGIGLTTDLVGLIPGLGAGAKGYKIGRTLTRFARPLMAAFTANNFKEAGEVLGKGVRNGFGSLNALDWTVLSTALTSMISRGKSAHTRLRNVEFMSKASQHSSPTDAKGNVTKHIINEKGFIKARKELLDLKRFGYNTASRNYTLNVWNSIPEGGEISTPFYAKPFEWSKFGSGKDKKLKLVEEFEKFLKNNKKPESSMLGNGPESPVVVPNENVNEYLPIITGGSRPLPVNGKEYDFIPLIEKGVKLKTLRNGGIIKAQGGLKTDGLINKYDNISDWTKLNFGVTEKLYFPGFMEARYDNRGNILYPHSSFPEQEEGDHFGDLSTNSAYDALLAYYLKDKGSHIFGDVLNAYNTWKSKNNGTVQDFINYYNGEVDWLRSQGLRKLLSKANSKGWRLYNQRFNNIYGNYSSYDSNLEDIIGESTWQRTPNTFKGITDLADLRLGILGIGDGATLVAIDNLGHLITNNLINPKEDIEETGKVVSEELKSAVDKIDPKETTFDTQLKNPMDPTPFITAGKTALGLFGNKDIYGNLLKEYPHPALQDPLHRQLAIVGDLRAIDDARNKLGDLRRILQQLIGYDPSRNFATSLETERVGRDVLDNGYNKDASRQFDTAQKLWNLKNEDTFTNWRTAYENRRAIENYNKTLAQIRAAWRSGNNNILMGAAADTGNWLMKKFQREQDLVDKTKELSLGTPEEQAQAALSNDTRYSEIMNKHASGQTLTDEEKAYIRRMLAEALKGIRGKFANSYYNMYHTPGFGGGYKESINAKDGSKLEIAKLKARSKDNDRYVGMIKNLRTTKRRRR